MVAAQAGADVYELAVVTQAQIEVHDVAAQALRLAEAAAIDGVDRQIMLLSHFLKKVGVVPTVVAIAVEIEHDASRVLLGLITIAIQHQTLIINALDQVLVLVTYRREGFAH